MIMIMGPIICMSNLRSLSCRQKRYSCIIPNCQGSGLLSQLMFARIVFVLRSPAKTQIEQLKKG